jgi:hypothetical protein
MFDYSFFISRMHRYQIVPQRHDQRTRLERNRQLDKNWSNQLVQLTLAYLKWKYAGDSSDVGNNTQSGHIFQVDKVGLRGTHIDSALSCCFYLSNTVQNVA